MLRGFARRATDRPVAAVFVVTAFALLLRLVGLGARSMHWDEARVAYWTLRYVREGTFFYRPTIHGPLVPILTAAVFERLGPTAFAARLPVAILGGLFPLVALLFRRPQVPVNVADTTDGVSRVDHPGLGIDDAETVTLAVVLAITPSLVYYSRFMRSDVPLAVFFFAAVGFLVRALTTGRRRYVVVAGLALGFALPTKENVLVYVACTLGTAAVAVCWPSVAAALRARGGQIASVDAATDELHASLRWIGGHLRCHWLAVPVGLLAAFVPVVFFFAPRGVAGDPSLGAAFAGEVSWPALVAQATLGTWETFTASHWTSAHEHSYLGYLWRIGAYSLVGGLGVVVGAGYAFVRELGGVRRRSGWSVGGPPRGGDGGRVFVVPFVAWGVAALLGYPAGTDIPAPWITLHVLLPLTVPAAVGIVALARGDWWRPPTNWRGYALAVLVVLSVGHVPLVVGLSSVTPVLSVNVLAQATQPADDLRPLSATVSDAADDGGVLYYGERYFLPNESVADRPPREGEVWLRWWVARLPMAWYVERTNASTAYARTPADVQAIDALPPVIFAHPNEADEVAPALTERGYQSRVYDTELYGDGAVVVFVDADRLDAETGDVDGTTENVLDDATSDVVDGGREDVANGGRGDGSGRQPDP